MNFIEAVQHAKAGMPVKRKNGQIAYNYLLFMSQKIVMMKF